MFRGFRTARACCGAFHRMRQLPRAHPKTTRQAVALTATGFLGLGLAVSPAIPGPAYSSSSDDASWLESLPLEDLTSSIGSLTEPQPSKLRVLVVGAGGVGTMACYALEAGGQAEVTAVLRSNYDVVRERGFDIQSVDHGEREPHLPPYDFVVVTTKNMPDIPPSVAELVAPAVTPGHTAIVLIQNGINIEQPLIAAFPANPVLSGISFITVAERAGTVCQADDDSLLVGAFPAQRPVTEAMADRAAAVFAWAYRGRGHLKVEALTADDLVTIRWTKLAYNASFNSASAVLGGLDVTHMRHSEHIIEALVQPLAREVLRVARAAGALPNYPRGAQDPDWRGDPYAVLDDAATEASWINALTFRDPWAAFALPSMGQDVIKGNYIEVETIVGEPMREADRLGVDVPTLRAVYAILKGLQWRTMERNGLVKVPLESHKGLKYGDEAGLAADRKRYE